MFTSSKTFRWSLLLGGMLAVGLLPSVSVQAQDSDVGDPVSSYRTGENSVRTELPNPDSLQTNTGAADPKTQGPVRMARFASVQGNVTWRPDSTAAWSKATTNLPLRQGAEIGVTQGGRADIQFDDGSALRLGNGALAVLKVLFSDAQGEFTEVALNDGLATLHSRHAASVFQVDTPVASVKFSGESQVRFGVDGGSEIAVQKGSAAVEGSAGKTTVEAGKYLYLQDASSSFTPQAIPGSDSWDRWNSDRNRLIEGKSETYRHVPANIGLVSEDLDAAGSWHEDSKYGWVWAPRVSDHSWRPYYYGHWVWVDPFGWTWVSDESWGWAPYHYGTWVELSYGWSWCPGPRSQYWSPGVVSFCSYGDRYGWAPLCPWEVRYPSAFSLGCWGNNWGFSFSIGYAGCYYPERGGYCVGRGYDNYAVNRWNYGDRAFGATSYDRFRASSESRVTGSTFIPYNASHSAGATYAGSGAFNGRGTYEAAPRGDTSLFTKGKSLGAPSGKMPISGPATLQPGSLSRTSTREFVTNARPSQNATERSLYRAPLPTNVQRSLPSTEARGTDTLSRTNRSGLSSGNPTGRISSTDSTSAVGRSRSGFDPGSANHRTVTTGALGSDRSAAEAARQARVSLGYTGSRSTSDLSRGNDRTGASSSGATGYRNGSISDRSYPTSSSHSTGSSTPSSSGRSYGGSSREYSPGSSSDSYRVRPDFGGGRSSGGNSSGGRSSSNGSSSGGSSRSSSGGGYSGGGSRNSGSDSSSSGGHSSGGGGSFNRGR